MMYILLKPKELQQKHTFFFQTCGLHIILLHTFLKFKTCGL